MNCDVCIGGDIEDYIDGYERSVVTAEKPLKCCECRKAIEIGDQYELVTGEFYSKPYRETTCLLCAEIANVFSCDEGRTHGDLWEQMNEHAFDRLTTASECFTALSAAAKARVLDKWRAWKGLTA